MKLLFIDTETGGLTPYRHSLLTLGVTHWIDGKIMPCSSREFKLKSDPYCVTATALKINGINLVEHDKTALTKERFREEFWNYLRSEGYDVTTSGPVPQANKIRLAGHNVGFDRGFLNDWLGHLEDRFHYRMVDISSILIALEERGLIPKGIGGGSDEAFKHFGIVRPEPHNAVNDAIAASMTYAKCLELMPWGNGV